SIRPGDEVLVSALTNMATFFAVLYQGAKPVPIDIDEDTWNLDPELLEARITPRSRAILVVHLFGHPVDMGPVLEIARRHRLYVVEDCAEAHGATYQGKKVGGLGDIGCFSFYANKIITTGEGGMLTLNDAGLAHKARSLKSLAFGIETREGFIPANMQQIFQGQGWTRADDCPKANDAGARSFYLPSGPSLSEEELEFIAASVREVLESL